ncbi:MAG: hypothetical protein WD577_10930 [Bacteroidales bacterium]
MECNSPSKRISPFRFSCVGIVIISLLLILVFPLTGFAQFYEYGQDRGTIRWNQFSTEHFRLIYPVGLDSMAMDFADKLEYFYPHQAAVMEHGHKKMPVVLHNESSFSNGVFVWAPRRLEVFTNPDPNGYPQDWMTQLALHEGRHALQVSKLNQGFSRFLSFIAGEQAVGAITGFLPLWYLEGDAVDAETRFSYTGRGRLPSFEMGMKAQLLEGDKRYTFSKAMLGSYTDYVPNHYELGYLMVRHGRRTYGNSFWNHMVDHAARRPYLIAPTYFSMKSYGVNSKMELYHAALDQYQSHWEKTFEKRKVDSISNWSSTGNRYYTSYRFPQWINDTTVIALKSGPDQIPEFVLVDREGDEERVFRPGYMNSGRFSYGAGKIVWDEWVPDIRWSNRNYSVIRIFDLAQKEIKNLGTRTRYYAPVISGSGDKIAAIEQRTDHTFHLVILNEEGEMIHSAGAPDNLFMQHPSWMEQDSALVVTVNDRSGEYLYRYSLGKQEWTELFHAGYNDISLPVVHKSTIFFGSTFSGIDNIYQYDLKDESLYRITSSAFGAFESDIHEGKILYSDYHADGYRAVSKRLKPDQYIEISDPAKLAYSAEQLDAAPTAKEQEIIEESKYTPEGEYAPGPYRKILHSVNIHSWLPLYFDYMNPETALNPEELPVSPGITILSQNLLSTVTGMAAYEYRNNMHFLHTGARLKGRYPVFDMGLRYGGIQQVYKMNSSDTIPVRPNRLSFVTNAYVPLRLNTGKFITYLQPLLSHTYTSDLFPNADRSAYESGIHRLMYRLYFSSYLRMGKMDVLPRLGVSARAGYRHAPFNRYNFGNQRIFGMTVYLPGLLKHQSVMLNLSTQKQEAERYLYTNDIELPRGYQDIVGLETKMAGIDYNFPIVYPDLSIEPLVYIKRIRGNLWGDYLQGKDILIQDPEPALDNRNYYSYGVDLLFDFHVLRFMFPFSMGARVAYLPQSGELKPEFLFTIDVN